MRSAIAVAWSRMREFEESFSETDETLTIGTGITIRGKNGSLFSAEGLVVNLGTINADTSEGAISVYAYGQGSSAMVSNLGMLPVEGFDAIVYPEHAAALASGAVAPTPVALPDGSIAVRPMARLTLTVDHRLVNGLAAARFLAAVKDFLEQGAFA